MNFRLLTLLLFLSFKPDKSLQQAPEFNIVPDRAKTNDNVEIICRNNRPGSSAVYFTISRVKQSADPIQIVRADVKCSSGELLRKSILSGFVANVRHSGCTSIALTDIPATQEIAGTYQCNLQHIMPDFSQEIDKSQPVQLTVGDPTPRVSQFQLTNAATGDLVSDQVAAGTNISVTCETGPANPAPDFTVRTLPDGTLLTVTKPGGAKDSRVRAYVLVPKQPRLAYRCQASNGFGEEQQADVTVNVTYAAVHSDVMTPTEITVQTVDEIRICSVANNPPKKLVITGLDSALIQPGYPRFEQKDGESRAYVKLAEGARSVEDIKYTCTIGDLDTRATVKLQGLKPDTTPGSSTSASTTRSNSSNAAGSQLSTPSSAMMTAGIAVAVGAALVIVIGIVIAVVMKKRKSGDKSSNGDNTRYGKVNQNDADPTIFDAHPTTKSIRVEDSKANEYNEA